MHNELWAVSISGPDDLIPVGSLLEAVRVANKFNGWWETNCAADRAKDPNWPMMWATPVLWNGDMESHAKALADSSDEYAMFVGAASERQTRAELVEALERLRDCSRAIVGADTGDPEAADAFSMYWDAMDDASAALKQARGES